MENPLSHQIELSRTLDAIRAAFCKIEATRITVVRCPYSNTAQAEALDQDDFEIDLSTDAGEVMDNIARIALEEALRFGDTVSATQDAVVVSELDGFGDPSDVAMIVDFGDKDYVQTQETTLGFDKIDISTLLDASAATLEAFGTTLQIQAVVAGEVYTLEHERSLLATTAEALPDDLSNFIAEIDEACDAIIDVHSDAASGIRTATLSIMETCPHTGKRLRAVYGSRKMTASPVYAH